MLVFIMLLLMPSITAIQKKTIEDRAYNDLVEPLDTTKVKELKDIEKLEGPKHPSIYYIVYFIAGFRKERANILFDISCHIDNWGRMDIYFPLLFIRMIWLDITVYKWCNFWNTLSDTLGWNCEDINDIILGQNDFLQIRKNISIKVTDSSG